MSEQPPNDPNAQQPPQQPGWQPPPPQYGGQYVPPPGYYPQPPTTSRATTALVLGIAGLVVCPFILSIPAWIIGHGAVKEIDASNGQLGGRSIATAGKVTGIIGTALGALGILLFIGIFIVGFATADCSGTSTDDSFSFNCS